MDGRIAIKEPVEGLHVIGPFVRSPLKGERERAERR
jgi:hypothetical protein